MKAFAAVLILALWIPDTTAQFSVETDMSMMQDDNIDNNYLQITDRITSASLGLEYLWSSEKYETGISYTGILNYYSSIIERSHSLHQFLFQYSHVFGEEDATTLDLYAGFSSRIDRGNYTAYDHQIYHGIANLQHDFSDITTAEGKYLFQVVRFKNLPDFNYMEHNISGQFSASFESRTSIALRSDFGLKVYSSQTSSTTDTTGGSGQGYGQGQMGGINSAITQTSSPTVTQLICMARIGQSIFEGTGISLTGQYQWNIRKESRYLLSNYGTIPDDVLFDDHYGYEGLLLSVMLTQILPFDSRIQLTASNQDRLYSTLPAYDLAWNLVADKRNDKRSIYTLQLKKDFETLGISVNATYDYIINSSNDAFYDYTNKVFTLGAAILF